MDNFPLQIEIKLDWGDMDVLGHINNIAFFRYIQSSRVNFWEAVSITNYYNDHKIGPVLLSCNFRFNKPLYFPGSIHVRSRLEFIKNSSFGLHHKIMDTKGELVAEAHDVMVMYDFNTHQKHAFPKILKENVERLTNH